MNCIEDEPRTLPKPVPFSGGSPLQPTVPEVSLLLQDTSVSCQTNPSNSFGMTEFQTYNAWRLKNIIEAEKENISLRRFSHSRNQELHSINKFSNTERRKNEILYGSRDEPRRPLPPRPVHVIPKCFGSSFSDVSLSSDLWNNAEAEDQNYMIISRTFGSKKINSEEDNLNLKVKDFGGRGAYEEQRAIKDLCDIIDNQNKQMVFLQKQIEKLTRSLESKEKQIDQLLKSQETKEIKIEQLLKMHTLKENHIEQLLKTQERHEKQIEQMIVTQEARKKQNIQLSNKLSGLDKKFLTTGTMTSIDINDKSTNTSFLCCCKGELNEEPSKQIQSSGECKRFDPEEKSFTLCSLDLPVAPDNMPTPQSSILVDIPEYNSSSDEDCDISSPNKEVQIHNLADSKPLGYTFYNNVLAQVNEIIHNHEAKDSEEAIKVKVNNGNLNLELEKEYQKKFLDENRMKIPCSLVEDKVERYWGINLYEPHTETDFQYRAKTLSSNYENQGINPAFQLRCDRKDTHSPSDISLRMNALALKYLKQEQISQYHMQFQRQKSSTQPDVTIYNVTNLSLGTMRYLEGYRMSSHDIDQ